MPPQQCLPFTDRLCYDSVLNSLSVKNILKVVAALLQERRVLFVSSQMDTLTLCAAAFVSFLYPFKWMHPLVPLLPAALIEYLEAPTPYLMGVQTHVYESDDCQAVIDGVVVVQLDYDKVIVPRNVRVETFPKSFLRKMQKAFQAHIPPPASECVFPLSRSAHPLLQRLQSAEGRLPGLRGALRPRHARHHLYGKINLILRKDEGSVAE